jgi:hypothetical protein
MSAHVRIPQAIPDALESGSISAEQFDVFFYCYLKANRSGYRVYSYSAANVCRFRWLDASTANVKKYERAAADLLARHLIRRDYYRIDPKRSAKAERTYSVWIPSPERFQRVGTPDENKVFLWRANVGLLVGDNVGLQSDGTASETSGYSERQTDTVGLLVGVNADHLSITDQESQKQERETPLNPPTGGLLPPAPQGEHSDAVGLFKTVHKRKPLTPEQCALLHEAAVQYANFTHALSDSDFIPDVKAIEMLFRNATPNELLSAYLSKQVASHWDLPKSTWAHFFAAGAKTLIESARLNGTFESPMPRLCGIRTHDSTKWPPMWKAVTDPYEKVFGVANENAGAKQGANDEY